MAHEISNIDKQQGIVQAWHGLTEIVQDLTVENNWLNTWDVVTRPMVILGADGKPIETPFKLMTASDDSSIQIGVPFAESYTVIKNKQFLDVIRESTLGIDGIKLASIGSICNRGRVFASFEIDAATHKVNGREFKNYWTVLNSFDKSSPFADVFSNTCCVCKNTFNLNANDKSASKIRHTKNSEQKLLDIPEKINAMLGAASEFNKIFEKLEDIKTNEVEAKHMFAGFLGEGKEMSTRGLNTVDRMVELFYTGKGNSGRTLGDVFSAVTDYYSHESSGGDDMLKQWVSSEFGAASKRKTEFLPNIIDTNSRNNLMNMGINTLALS